jgi:XTP/dITP diphosphohydrolase
MTPTLAMVTSNPDKLAEAERVLAPLGIRLEGVQLELVEPMVEEMSAIVRAKASQAAAALGRPLLVDEAGLFLDAYAGFPGPFTKHVMRALGYGGLARLTAGGAELGEMRALVAYWEPGGTIEIFEGRCRGRVLAEPVGAPRAATPLSRVFVPEGFTQPLALLDGDALLRTSHRARALREALLRLGPYRSQ